MTFRTSALGRITTHFARRLTTSALCAIGITAVFHRDELWGERRLILSHTPSPEMHRLKNGLTIILARDTTLPIVAIAVSYHVGAANEDSGRREFSHLFEHLMVGGTDQVALGLRRIQEAGGRADATTDFDRTYYYQEVPSNYLEVVLWLESYRMAFPISEITQKTLDLQRSVVLNEHRQRRENAPYGMAFWRALSALHPSDHPYAISPEGWLTALEAATLSEVQSFFTRFYGPNNATLAIVGNIDLRETLGLVERYFGGIRAIPAIKRPRPQPVRFDDERHVLLEDRVELPALYFVWPTDPVFGDGDADLHVLARILAGGRNSRLYRRLIEQDHVAQAVTASQEGWALAGQFMVTVRGVPGQNLNTIRDRADEEIARLIDGAAPSEREVARAVSQIERLFAERDESALQRAVRLTMYNTFTKDAGFGEKDLARYRRVTPASVQETARRYLRRGRVVLSVVPKGKAELQAIR